jgi:hypothetical protein
MRDLRDAWKVWQYCSWKAAEIQHEVAVTMSEVVEAADREMLDAGNLSQSRRACAHRDDWEPMT